MGILSRLAGIFFSGIVLLAADVSGTWTGVIPTRNKDLQDITFKFTQAGDKLTGKMYRDTTGVSIIDGKISGERVTFTVISEEQVGNLFIDIKYFFAGSIRETGIELTREREANPMLTTGNPASRVNQKPTFELKRLF
jgi:hypothetical protein